MHINKKIEIRNLLAALKLENKTIFCDLKGEPKREISQKKKSSFLFKVEGQFPALPGMGDDR